MKVLSTDGLTKLIQLIKSSFISVDDTVTTNSVTLATVATSGSYNDLSNKPTIPDTSTLANKDLSNLSSTGNAKFQAPLVSGTNIKTINGNSILGSGNLALDGLPSQTGQSGKFLTTNGTRTSWDNLPVATASTAGIVKPNNSSIKVDSSGTLSVDINNIAANLNSKADADLTNVTDTAKVMMSGVGMPGNKYIDLTLGASGTTYTAPENGWFCFYAIKSTAGYTFLMNNTTGFRTETRTTINGSGCGCYIPARRGDIIVCNYDGTNDYPFFRFYYAEGSESEAS